jgi:hypothetical protein
MLRTTSGPYFITVSGPFVVWLKGMSSVKVRISAPSHAAGKAGGLVGTVMLPSIICSDALVWLFILHLIQWRSAQWVRALSQFVI